MTMSTVRQWHGYLGVFIAPSVLFFALTGSLQIFGLHEAHGDYQPPALVERLGRLHKDQVFALSHHHKAPEPASGPGSGAAKAKPKADDGPGLATLLLKVFFLVVAISLAVSTSLGVWIALTRNRRARLSWALLIAGAVIPLALTIV